MNPATQYRRRVAIAMRSRYSVRGRLPNARHNSHRKPARLHLQSARLQPTEASLMQHVLMRGGHPHQGRLLREEDW
jgi:hypothetical protein